VARQVVADQRVRVCQRSGKIPETVVNAEAVQQHQRRAGPLPMQGDASRIERTHIEVLGGGAEIFRAGLGWNASRRPQPEGGSPFAAQDYRRNVSRKPLPGMDIVTLATPAASAGAVSRAARPGCTPRPVHRMTSSAPSKCSTTAVQLSIQSPQLT